MPTKYTPEQRIAAFWNKVDKSGGEDACWLWTAATKGEGYGAFWLGKRLTGAHQFSYVLAHGEIPNGLLVLHQCDNVLCVNPKHLFAGTQQQNVDDCIAKQRHAHGEKLSRKLTWEDVRAIRQRYAAGITQRALAKDYSVSPGNISMIVGYITWKE